MGAKSGKRGEYGSPARMLEHSRDAGQELPHMRWHCME